MPLIFGGVLGPEAGLVGIIAGLCYWVSDSLKFRGKKLSLLKNKQDNETLSETSIAVVLGIIFGSPLFGIVNNIEPDNKNEHYVKKLLEKKDRIFIYIMEVLGGFISLLGLNKLLTLFGIPSNEGIPRFDFHRNINLSDWKMFIIVFLVGIISAIIYTLADKYTKRLGEILYNKRIVSCVCVGIIIAVVGYFSPYTLFSGEHQMRDIMDNWKNISVIILLISAFAKLILVNLCINLGWRGGSIFPIIFSGVSLGYAMAILLGINGSFSVAILISSMYGYISKKPVATIAILFLCFPITYFIPIIISSVLASKIPSLFFKRNIIMN